MCLRTFLLYTVQWMPLIIITNIVMLSIYYAVYSVLNYYAHAVQLLNSNVFINFNYLSVLENGESYIIMIKLQIARRCISFIQSNELCISD